MTLERQVDVAIVGSGAGGGTAAKELAELTRQGLKVAVFEKGPELESSDYSGQELDMSAKLFVEGGGVMTSDGNMTLAMGSAVGGSTTVYTGVTFKIAKPTLEKWAVPGLDWGDLDRRMGKYMVENNVRLLEEEKINENNRLFKQACQKLGYHVDQFPINVKGCKGSSLCNLGCPNNAKQGTAQVQLPAAKSKGVEVVSNCTVQEIRDGELTLRVSDARLGRHSVWAPGTYRVKAKAIVLAAGSIHSSTLLLKSGYGEKLPTLGKYFTAHPALIMVGQHERSISNYQGFPKSYYSEEFAERDRFLLETCMYFPFVTAKSLAGFGRDHAKLMSDFSRLQMILALALDPAVPENRIEIGKKGEPIIHYSFDEAVLEALVGSMRASARIFFASGAERVHLPASKDFFIEKSELDTLDQLITRDYFKLGKVIPAAAHLMGGCRMGGGAQDSVTDSWGRVHGEPGLYVADAGLFPACSEVNPYLTIMGLADRVAEGVKKDLPYLLNR